MSTSTGLSKFGRRRLTARLVSEKYGVCIETINRWTKAGILRPPFWINGLRYWDEEKLEARDRERAPMTNPARAANLTRKSANTEPNNENAT